MASVILRSTLFIVLTIYVFGDELEMEVQSKSILRMLREMVNQTAAESLNLPANATSIRENITDSFSCENRTYGYYADVENECQLFHVCLPSQTPSGRNVTYKWSFICPQETVFNQEVLVCTRSRDSIPCEESPSFYYLNMEIGKIVEPETNKGESDATQPNKETEKVPTRKQSRNPNRKKQNIIMDALLKEADDQMEAIEEVLNEKPAELDTETDMTGPEITIEEEPEVKIENPLELDMLEPEVNIETIVSKPHVEATDEFADNTRLGLERAMKRTGRKIWRGSMKFKSDV